MRRIKPKQTAFATTLRNNATDAERALWKLLRGDAINGLRFRRQLPIGTYIVDFVCFEARVIVEVDGGQHIGSGQDAQRDAWLKSEGFAVLRFWNNDVLQNIEGVRQVISEGTKLALASRYPFSGHDVLLPPLDGNEVLLPPLDGEGWGEVKTKPAIQHDSTLPASQPKSTSA